MPKALVFYQFLHPDDVVSAVHFTDLCTELARRGWSVTAMPSNRSCRYGERAYAQVEEYKGVRIRRLWRPDWPQSTNIGRFSNAVWMLFRWSAAVFSEGPDVIVVGTDPIFSVSIARFWKLLRPSTRIAHWCFDLYPEAAFADGIVSRDSWAARILMKLLASAYRSCDLLCDLGRCMAERIQFYEPRGRQITVTPWALAEPDQPLAVNQEERKTIFGSVPVALMYSGNFGRAHSSELMLRLARRLDPRIARVAFSVRGNRVEELRRDAASIASVKFVPFADSWSMEARLSAADIHIVSLREEWTGTVVPSKFFGALAAGRPVLFAGSADSAVARWIRQHQVGWVLTESSIDQILEEISSLQCEPDRLGRLFAHCHEVYRKNFSKKLMMDTWDAELRALCA